MSSLTPALALRTAINVLRDSAESRKMPSGEPLDDAVVQFTSTPQIRSKRRWPIFETTSRKGF
jgi:hypothetical protein